MPCLQRSWLVSCNFHHEDMTEDMPGRMPEDMPDRMPEDMSGTKCINAMVGITRSKALFIFF